MLIIRKSKNFTRTLKKVADIETIYLYHLQTTLALYRLFSASNGAGVVAQSASIAECIEISLRGLKHKCMIYCRTRISK